MKRRIQLSLEDDPMILDFFDVLGRKKSRVVAEVLYEYLHAHGGYLSGSVCSRTGYYPGKKYDDFVGRYMPGVTEMPIVPHKRDEKVPEEKKIPAVKAVPDETQPKADMDLVLKGLSAFMGK